MFRLILRCGQNYRRQYKVRISRHLEYFYTFGSLLTHGISGKIGDIMVLYYCIMVLYLYFTFKSSLTNRFIGESWLYCDTFNTGFILYRACSALLFYVTPLTYSVLSLTWLLWQLPGRCGWTRGGEQRRAPWSS